MLTNSQNLNNNEVYDPSELNDNKTSISPQNISSRNSQFHEEYNLYKNEYENSNYRTNESVLTTKSSEQPNNLKHYDAADNNLYKGLKDTSKIKNPLESVPERSIEQSQTTNLNRSQEIESLRFRNDFETDHNKYGTNQSLSSANGANKFDKYEANFKASNKYDAKQYDIDKSSVGYISPRFQMENSEIGRNKHSKSHEKYALKEDIDSVLSSSKKVNINTAIYPIDAINKKQPESYNFQFKSPVVDRPLRTGASHHLKSGNLSVDYKGNKPNFSDLDFIDKVDEKRYHSKSDASNLLNERYFDDYGSVLQIERDKVSKLEERLINKEKLLAQMRAYHTELWDAYELVLKELQKTKEEKEIKFEDMSVHIENLNKKIIGLEEREFELEKRNEELSNLNDEKISIVRNLERENDNIKHEIIMSANEYRAKIEALQLKNKRLEREPQLEKSRRDSFYYNNKSHEIEDRIYLKQVDDLNATIKDLSKENEELTQKIDTMLRYRQKEKSFHKADDSIHENRNHHNRAESFKINTPADHSKYLEIINRLKEENENLRIVLQSKPTLRKYKENEGKLQSLEADLEEARNLSREMRRSFSGDVGFSKKMLKSIIDELQIESIGEILPRIIELIHYERSTTKFTMCIQDLVLRCSPPGCFSSSPTLKQSWKWLKGLMEEYMNLKKLAGNENDKSILKDVMDYLVVEEKGEVTSQLKKVLVDNNLMNKIISKIKILHNIQWANSLHEIDDKLELELEGEIQIDSDRRKKTYKKNFN